MTSTEGQTIWKPYLDYPFIEANQFGEIRTKDHYVSNGVGKRLVKGHILKQWDNGHGYMTIRFRIDRKTINLYVHRIVAICFLPNPANLPEVNHKDSNPKNNAVSNLEWCTRQYNQAYKEKYGTSSAEACGRPVFAVDLDTGKVLYFESQWEASRQLGVRQSHISSVVKGRLNQVGGYWFTEDENEITEEKIQEVKAKMNFRGCVIAINIETSEVFLFESQSEAARQLHVSLGNLNSVVKGKLNKTKGLWFCYADENSVEKVREKFGDEIAKNFKKLMIERKQKV